jgi:hypothetical protein
LADASIEPVNGESAWEVGCCVGVEVVVTSSVASELRNDETPVAAVVVGVGEETGMVAFSEVMEDM